MLAELPKPMVVRCPYTSYIGGIKKRFEELKDVESKSREWCGTWESVHLCPRPSEVHHQAVHRPFWDVKSCEFQLLSVNRMQSTGEPSGNHRTSGS